MTEGVGGVNPRVFLSPLRKKKTHTHTHTHTHPWEDQREWHRMTRMTRPDCAVMCNLINTHTHTHKDDKAGLRGYVQFNKYAHTHTPPPPKRAKELPSSKLGKKQKQQISLTPKKINKQK